VAEPVAGPDPLSAAVVAAVPGLVTTLAGVIAKRAVGVELYQRARGEGQASWLDALATAAPGLLLAGAVLLAGVG
jgi:hypothetical protein